MELVAQYSFAIKLFTVLFVIAIICQFSIWKLLVWLSFLVVNLLNTFVGLIFPASQLHRRLSKVGAIVTSQHFFDTVKSNPWGVPLSRIKYSILKNDAYVLDDRESIKVRVVCNNHNLDMLLDIKKHSKTDGTIEISANILTTEAGVSTTIQRLHKEYDSLSPDKKKLVQAIDDAVMKETKGGIVGLYTGRISLQTTMTLKKYRETVKGMMDGQEAIVTGRVLVVQNVATNERLELEIKDDATEEQIEEHIKTLREFTSRFGEFDEESVRKLENIIKLGAPDEYNGRPMTIDDIPDVTTEGKINTLQKDEAVKHEAEDMMQRFRQQRKINFGKVADLTESEKKGGTDA